MADLDRLTALVSADPEVQRLQALLRSGNPTPGVHPARGGIVNVQNQLTRRLQALGVDTGEYHLTTDDNGRPQIKEKSWLDKHGSKLPFVGVGALAAGVALPALMSGGGATAAGTGATAAGTGTAATGAGVGAGAGTTAAATGGGIMAGVSRALPYLDAAGRVAGAASDQRAANRAVESDEAARQDLASVRLSEARNSQVRTDLDQREFLAREAQRHRRNAVVSDLLRSVQDANISAPSQVPRSQISGGLRPSAIPSRVEIGNVAYQDAIDNLLDPVGPGGIGQADGSVSGRGGGSRNLPTLPHLPDLRETSKPSGVDRGLDWLNLGAAGLGYLQRERQAARTPPIANAPLPGTRPQPSWLPPVSFR
jgi:hypothetical protein